MGPSTGYTGIFMVGSRFDQSRHGHNARVGAIHLGAKGFRKRSRIIFYPGVQGVGGINRNSAPAIITRFVKNGLQQMISVVSHALSRLFRFFTFGPERQSEPIRVQPLKSKAKIGAWPGDRNDSSFEKTGRSDAEALLEMKRNPVTSVYEVKRIIAAVG